MANRTLQVNGQDFVINRDKKADVTQLTVNGSAFTVDRTAPVIDSDPVGNSRPLLGKLVGDAAAAYSLRDLNTKQGDTDVVNVRRSLDNSEKIFKAKDVPTIEDWTNGKQETTLPAENLAVTVEGGSEVAGKYYSTNVTYATGGVETPVLVYYNNALTVPLKIIRFKYGSELRWRFERQDNHNVVIDPTNQGVKYESPADVPISDWTGTGNTAITSITKVSNADAAYSLRKVNSTYGIPVTEVNGTDGFPTTITGSSQSITGTSFTVREFSNNSPDSSEATAANGVYRVSATKTSAASFAKSIRIRGLEDGKQYTVKGEFRMVEDTTSGGDSAAAVDISDDTAGTDEDAVSTTSTTFVPFLIDAGYNSGSLGNFVDFTVTTVGSETGTITAEFRNVQIIENNNSAVRIRRSSDDVEVIVGFDSDDKVSASSAITNVSEEGGESGSTTATNLNGFLNETLDDRFSTVTYPDTINSNYRQWTSLTATSNSFSATTGTVNSDNARYNYVLPSDISASDGAMTTFRISGTVNYTTSTGSGNGFFLKFTNYINGGGSHDFGSISLTGVGTIQSNKLRFNHGDNGDFLIDVTGNGTNIIRSIAFLQTEVTSGTTSISLTNLKFEIIKHGATVHTWYDQAGSNNAVQDTAANQPKIAESGALLADGLKFDGTNDMLTNSNVGAMQASDGMSSFTVHKKRVASTSTTFGDDNPQYLYHLCDTSLSDTVLAHRIVGGQLSALRANAAGDGYLTTTTTNHLIKTTKNLSSAIGSSGFQNHFNATIPAESAENSGTSYDSTTTELTIGAQDGIGGGGRFYDGEIEELIIYKSDQSANRFKIESNINNYYGLYNDANELTQTEWQATGAESFSSTSTDGFSYSNSSSTAFIGVTLSETLPLNDSVFVSFNASGVDIPDESPQIRLRDSVSGGTATSSLIGVVQNGFNSFELTYDNSSYANGDNIVFSEGNTGGGTVTISDFKVSRIARDGFVETWYDQSGNDRHASQIEEQAQPYIVINGGNVKTAKGFYAIDQDGRKAGSGVNQKAGLKTEYNPTGTDGALTEYSVFALYELYSTDSTNINSTLFSSGGAAGNAGYGGIILRNTSGSRIMLNNTDGNATGGGSFSSATSIAAATASNLTAYGSIHGIHLISGHFKHGVGMITREDGVTSADAEPNAPIPHASNSTYQGKVMLLAEFTYQQTNPWHGRASEIIFYEKDHRLNTEAIETNINNQYQIYS